MEQGAIFFAGTNRRVILGSPTLQTTSRRICIPIRMPLTGESVVGMPNWVAEGFDAVSKFASEMRPEIEQVADITLAFANDNAKAAGALFENPSAKAPNAEMKNFSVVRVDDPDGDPEVELQFKAYMPFARDLWRWVGEMGGKEVYMAFPSSTGKAVAIAKPDDQAKLAIADDPTEAETKALASDTNPSAGETKPGSKDYEDQVRKSLGAQPAKPRLVDARPRGGRTKSGPKELAAYHQNQQGKNGATKRPN